VPTIGKISIGLEAEYAQFSQSITKASKDIEQVGHSAEHAGGGVHTFFDNFKEGLGIGLGIELVKAGFELATEAIEKSVEAVREWVGESLKTQQEAFRTAQTLKLHTDTLEGLQSAAKKAGLDSEAFSMALEKTNHNIGEAAIKGGESAEAFTRLGLSAKTLAGQSLDTNIRQIADAISAIKNPAEQAAAAGAIFGERIGPKLLPLLNQGSAGINQFIAEAKEAGVALGDVDAAKLVAAKRGLDTLGERAEGAKNQLTLALAPSILAIGNSILNIIPPADKMKGAFETAFRIVILTGANAADILAHVLSPIVKIDAALIRLESHAAWGSVKAGMIAEADALDVMATKLGDSNLAQKAQDWLVKIEAQADKTAHSLADGMGGPVADLSHMAEDNGKKIEEILKHLHESLATSTGKPKELFDLQNLHASTSQIQEAKNILDEISQNKIHIEVDKSLTEMAKEIATFGMNANQKKLFDLEGMGLSKDQMELATAYVKKLEQLESHKKDEDAAKKVIEESLSPLDKYQEKMGEINRLQSEGLLSQNQAASAADKAFTELAKTMKDPYEGKKVAAEARRFDFAGPKDAHMKADPMVELKNTAKQQLDETKKAADYLAEIYRFGLNQDTKDNQTIVVDF
jgi:hypothetical protein